MSLAHSTLEHLRDAAEHLKYAAALQGMPTTRIVVRVPAELFDAWAIELRADPTLNAVTLFVTSRTEHLAPSDMLILYGVKFKRRFRPKRQCRPNF